MQRLCARLTRSPKGINFQTFLGHCKESKPGLRRSYDANAVWWGWQGPRISLSCPHTTRNHDRMKTNSRVADLVTGMEAREVPWGRALLGHQLGSGSWRQFKSFQEGLPQNFHQHLIESPVRCSHYLPGNFLFDFFCVWPISTRMKLGFLKVKDWI
jgi:hypothetical protein